MSEQNATAGPSRPRKPSHPFISANERPEGSDGRFRVVIISSGSVASVKIPDIVGALVKDPSVDVQIVATKSSLHFYNQEKVDRAVRDALSIDDDQSDIGVKVWTDEDEWSDWKQLGDPILHIELRRWADLVIVAPCSTDMLAKIAGGLCDNLATSLLRALSPSTPTILCPAMNTHMYQHPLTADHLRVAQEKLGYMISGPQGAGRLACGDEGPGKMTDWRDIVDMVLNFASMCRERKPPSPAPVKPDPTPGDDPRPKTPPTPGERTSEWTERAGIDRTDFVVHLGDSDSTTSLGKRKAEDEKAKKDLSALHWRTLTNGNGGDGSLWDKKWWF